MNVLLVFLGAGIGGLARYGLSVAAFRSETSFPWATAVINVSGSLAMGVLIGWLTMRGGGTQLKLFAATGVLGGYTTFSTFSLEAFMLMERGNWSGAIGYVLGSVLMGIAGLGVGIVGTRQLLTAV